MDKFFCDGFCLDIFKILFKVKILEIKTNRITVYSNNKNQVKSNIFSGLKVSTINPDIIPYFDYNLLP
jgi:hypothetical protein